MANLREIFIEVPILKKNEELDHFINFEMNPRVKRYLRIYDLFSNCANIENADPINHFLEKYAGVYPTQFKLEERFNGKGIHIRYLEFFFLIPAFKRRIINVGDLKWDFDKKP